MTTKFELFFKRIKEAAKASTDKELCMFLGLNKSTLSMWKSREKVDYDLLFTKFEQTDLNWLITGESIDRPQLKTLNEPTGVYKLRTDINISDQSIPLYDLEATAGLVNLFQRQGDSTPIDYISIPNLPKCDGALSVTGDSMYPLLKSGDIVMYKELENSIDNIFWGEMYLISMMVSGGEMVSVKWIQKSSKGDKYIKLVSENQHHQPKDINLKNVKAIALVKASIRINAMS